MTQDFKMLIKHVLASIIILTITFSFSYTIFNLCFPKKPPEPEIVEIPKIEYVPYPEIQIVEKEVEKIVYIENEKETQLDFSDIKLIAGIVCAEAGNQDFIGKRLVVDVILNRYYDSAFPNTIEGVIFQPGQFNAVIYMDGYSEIDLEAVCAELKQRIDPDIYYFASGGFHSGHEKAYQHGDHYFSYK